MVVAGQASLISFPSRGAQDGELTVFEGAAVPFAIARVFVVRSGGGTTRGRHAHKRCNQLMVCVNGRCEVTCSDGSSNQTFLLDGTDHGLLVPCGVWAEESYLDSGTVLMVLCDRPYEENDYIGNYEEFLAFKKAATSSP